jgi:phosphatidylserine decarboxylase
MARRAAIRAEQWKQAAAIHGGIFGLFRAVLALKLSRVTIPSARLRRWLFHDLYVKLYPPGPNAAEAELPLEQYRSFNAVFTRGIKPEYRPIPSDARELSCPCDGTVQDVGDVADRTLMTVKGIKYSLDALLVGVDACPFAAGRFAIIFLSPIDCHRVFSPVDGWVEEIVHVPGARLLVHPPFQRPEFPVYELNERMIIRLSTAAGPCVLVMVAGWGVGNITFPVRPGGGGRLGVGKARDAPVAVCRGDWIATFELGSTVVMITSDALAATPLIVPNQKVRYGEAIFRGGAAGNRHAAFG